jgi:two-component system nitrogen regulation sensor histidine kinase NtrY
MIEQTASVVSRQHRRIESLQHLSSWQEAARRHAHEIRTPVTAARLEVERLASVALQRGASAEIERAKESALEELDRLARYTSEFSSFAKLPAPVRRVDSISDVLREFCRAFGGAWPNLTLTVDASDPASASIDRDMLRQICANLCANSSLAVDGHGRVNFSIRREGRRILVDVADDGRGIDPAVRPRLFQPYATTRRIGEGMGLGLAICRKIMLDHDGDLDLVRSDASGTTFRMTFPSVEEQP